MRGYVCQGDILKVEKLEYPVYVASKDFLNKTGKVIGVPILDHTVEGPLHIPIDLDFIKGFACCEEIRALDLNVRTYEKLAHVSSGETMNLVDAIQGIFDYV